MVGMADDGTLILELYPLKENAPSGDDQKEKVSEIDEEDVNAEEGQKGKVDEEYEKRTQAGNGNQDKSSEEVPEQSEPMIIYVDRELAAVVLRVSLQDFLQLVGVDDPKRDRGEVTKVYGDGFVQLQLIDCVSVEY